MPSAPPSAGLLLSPCTVCAADPPAAGRGGACTGADTKPAGLTRAPSDGTATSEQRGASPHKRPAILGLEEPDVPWFNIDNIHRKGGTPGPSAAGNGKATLSESEEEDE